MTLGELIEALQDLDHYGDEVDVKVGYFDRNGHEEYEHVNSVAYSDANDCIVIW
jgi:hypothetical protein